MVKKSVGDSFDGSDEKSPIEEDVTLETEAGEAGIGNGTCNGIFNGVDSGTSFIDHGTSFFDPGTSLIGPGTSLIDSGTSLAYTDPDETQQDIKIKKKSGQRKDENQLLRKEQIETYKSKVLREDRERRLRVRNGQGLLESPKKKKCVTFVEPVKLNDDTCR